MRRLLSSFSWSVVVLTLLVAGAVGATGALLLTPPEVPPTLASAEPLGEVAVAQRQFDDARTVEVSLETGGERHVSSPLAGTLTVNDCRPGGTLESGHRTAAVDGNDLTGLATVEPLWRDLVLDDSGDDVRALQTELVRLGYPTRVDGIVGRETLRAASRLLGQPKTLDAVPFSAFAWLPSPTVTTTSCPALVGGTIGVGEPLAVLPVALTGVRLTTQPEELVAGDRTLTVVGVHVHPSKEGAVTDLGALDEIAATPEYASATGSGSEPTVPGELALTSPLAVTVVPPAALYGTRSESGCVAAGSLAVPVTIVGSELGEAFVVPKPSTDGATPPKLSTVSLAERRPSCR